MKRRGDPQRETPGGRARVPSRPEPQPQPRGADISTLDKPRTFLLWLDTAVAAASAVGGVRSANGVDTGRHPVAPLTLRSQARSLITLQITAGSSLPPNTEVTLKVSGEAQEEITGGTVILTLPTKATMDHAGAGKPPYYPQGEEMPVTASWELPAMDAGDTWEKTVTIPAAVAGYYMAAARAYSEGPAGDLGPYLSNDMYAQAWMLVDDTAAASWSSMRILLASRTASGAGLWGLRLCRDNRSLHCNRSVKP